MTFKYSLHSIVRAIVLEYATWILLSVEWGLKNKSQPLGFPWVMTTENMEAICWEQVCLQYVCILQHNSLGFTCKDSISKLLSNQTFCGISHMQRNNFQKSTFNCMLFYLTLRSLEVISLNKETDKAMKWWVCILDRISEIILSLLVQTSAAICQRKGCMFSICFQLLVSSYLLDLPSSPVSVMGSHWRN